MKVCELLSDTYLAREYSNRKAGLWIKNNIFSGQCGICRRDDYNDIYYQADGKIRQPISVKNMEIENVKKEDAQGSE
jgi:hypothetical protein